MDHIEHTSLDDHLNDSLELHYETCFFCNGYYGPCFGEPLCGTCHDFMYSEDDGGEPSSVRLPASLSSEKDDGDSGNDEPSEDAAPVAPLPNPAPVDVAFPMPLPLQELEANPEPAGAAAAAAPVFEDEAVNVNFGVDEDANQVPWVILRPPAPNMDRMTLRLNMLTTPLAPHELVSTEDTSLRLPPEIWSIIFKNLAPVNLLMASKVSTRWKTMIMDQYPDEVWEQFVRTKLPIFHPMYAVSEWYSIASDFVDSLPCKSCFMNMSLSYHPNINTTVRSLRSVRLTKEIKWLRADNSIEGIEAIPLDDINYNWLARMNGPRDSPYQGGVFYLNLKVCHEYPLRPPIVRFLTKIFHPNISRHGDIGLDCIQHNWTLALTIPQTLLSVQSLLTDPYIDEHMEPGVAELYQKDKNTFDRIARIWTWKYAMHDVLIH